MNATKKKRVFLPRKLLIALAVFVTLAAAGYFATAAYFHSHFLPSTTLNGMDVSGKTQEEVEAMITGQIDGYELKLIGRGGGEETLKGMDISLKPEFGDSIANCVERQNPFAWPVALFQSQQFQEETVVSFDEDALWEKAKSLDCMKKENQSPPLDARCSEYMAGGYQVIPEEQGNEIIEKKFRETIEQALSNLEETVSLEEKDCYKTPNVTSEDKELTGLVDTLNQYTGVTLTYEAGEKTRTLDGSTTHAWMVVDGSNVSVNEQAVAEYVDELASEFNTVFRKHTLKTSYGTTIDITNGDYGWKVDKEAEQQQIINDIQAGKPVKREPVYARRAKSHGENDYGDTYVEINLTAQHLFFYKNGSLVVESDFVSGNLSKHYDTPTGIYGLTYKERNATLKGENYATPVSYWMPFCNNVGMHDASWRSSFGGNIYKTSGSHGCINLPPGAAQKIFEQIEEGDPVLVYTLPGTESPAAVAQEAAQVVNLINAIGEVTLESEPAIAAARAQYNLLSEAGQAQVPNYDVLVAAEAQLAALKSQVAPPEAPPEQPALPQ